MKIALRRLTAREHVLAASVLVFALTMIAADIALPDAARLRSAGHLTTASILSVLPVFALALSRQHCLRQALLALLPRTGNNSPHALFRLMGRLPLLVRYVFVGLLFCGLEATIKRLGGYPVASANAGGAPPCFPYALGPAWLRSSLAVMQQRTRKFIAVLITIALLAFFAVCLWPAPTSRPSRRRSLTFVVKRRTALFQILCTKTTCIGVY